MGLRTPLTLVNITDTESINLQHKRKRAIYSAHHILNYRRDTHRAAGMIFSAGYAQRPSADLMALPIAAHPSVFQLTTIKPPLFL
jgi:hypothetical protein